VKYEVLITHSAEADLEEAYLWLAERAPQSAVEWYNGVLNAFLTLERFPERCPLAPEHRTFKQEIRQLLHGKRHSAYRILFDISGTEVRILHIRHGARDTLKPG
jgi:plasmid stabilization system protein ParE